MLGTRLSGSHCWLNMLNLEFWRDLWSSLLTVNGYGIVIGLIQYISILGLYSLLSPLFFPAFFVKGRGVLSYLDSGGSNLRFASSYRSNTKRTARNSMGESWTTKMLNLLCMQNLNMKANKYGPRCIQGSHLILIAVVHYWTQMLKRTLEQKNLSRMIWLVPWRDSPPSITR